MHDPFLISADTKSKLGSFRYVNLPQLNMPIPDAEDNMMAAPKQDEALPAVNPSGDTPKPTSQTKPTTQQPENNPCPQTPAHRIPLADLISNTEDAFNCLTAKTYTPEDHVYWDHRGSNPKDKGSSPLAARKKKRCRSSSPTSSPLNADSKPHLSASQAPPRKLMKTPQHDVAADLWTKYLGKNNRPGDDTVPKIHFSQLVSSPQTPAPAAGRNSRSSGGLRRTSSCTADWPTSESKKRRLNSDIQANNNRIRDGFARSRSSILESGNSKASRIGMLIEKIQESLVKRSEEDIQGPSSSSPLPERPDYVQDRLASPTKDFDAERQLETPSKSPAKRNHPPAADLSFDDEELEQQMLSSEFGDDDLDNVFLELAVASPEKRPPVTPQADDPRGTANEAHHSHDEQVGAEAVAVDREQSKQVPEMPPPPQPSSQYGSTNDDVLMNGFDDDDDDDFLPDGIDAILAECDDLGALPAAVQPDTIQQAPPGAGGAGTEVMADNTNIKPGNLDEFDSEDTYGDDEFDAGGIDLEELERNMLQSGGGGLSATQATSSQVGLP
jgi:DNA replication ATP-dependent helicase Dna2